MQRRANLLTISQCLHAKCANLPHWDVWVKWNLFSLLVQIFGSKSKLKYITRINETGVKIDFIWILERSKEGFHPSIVLQFQSGNLKLIPSTLGQSFWTFWKISMWWIRIPNNLKPMLLDFKILGCTHQLCFFGLTLMAWIHVNVLLKGVKAVFSSESP